MRRGRSPAVVAARVVVYFRTAWRTIAALAAGLFPGALSVTLALAAYFTFRSSCSSGGGGGHFIRTRRFGCS